jgi:hypothetical protein
MKYKDIITGEETQILTTRKNASKYELMQAAVRQSAQEWQIRTAEKTLSYAELLHDIRIFEKYAKKYGLQRELRENGII